MKCAICLYFREGEAEDAITIKGGTAVCEDHMGYATDDNVASAIRLAREGMTDG